MSKRSFVLLALSSAVLLAAPSARGDTITLRDQTELVGKIVQDTGSEIVIETKKGQERVARDRVLAIVRDSGSPPAPTTPAKPDGAPPEEKKPAAATEAADLAEATRDERQGLELEGQGKFEEGMARFEAAASSILAGPAPADKEARDERSARLEFLLRRCVFFWNKLSRHERASKLLARAAATETVSPYVRGVARFHLSLQLRAAGKPAEAQAELEKLGFGTAWLVIGPFDNERGNGFGNEAEPETTPFDPKAVYKGKKRDVAWRPNPVAKPFTGEVDLKAMLRPNDQSLAYALSYLYAEK